MPQITTATTNSTTTTVTKDNNNHNTNTIKNQNNRRDELVSEPTNTDVLCGRGGNINSHPGNEKFRKLVERRKRIYLSARFKTEKRLVASSIVDEIRALKPPGRFLAQDPTTGLWKDIGDEKARDKTSQALRENAPEIRAEITEQRAAKSENNKRSNSSSSTAAAAAATSVADRDGVRMSSSSSSSAAMADSQPSSTPQQQQQQQQPPHPPPPHHWGYPTQYGYPPTTGHYPPHPPPPGHHPHYPPHPPPPGYWGSYYPPPPQHTTSNNGAPPQQQQPKSKLQQTASMYSDIVSSGADTIMSWTKTNLVGAITNGPAAAAAAANSSKRKAADSNSSTAQPKSILFVHGQKERHVKFQEDEKCQRYRSSANSLIVDQDDAEMDDIDPEQVESLHIPTDSSLMGQVANRIVSSMHSIGSFDASALCGGQEGTDDRSTTFFNMSSNGHEPDEAEDEEMDEVEWEGQEVQLIEDEKKKKALPPVSRRPNPLAAAGDHTAASSVALSVGVSSLGSCPSWLSPIAAGADSAASFGMGSRHSMDMSLGMMNENFSTGDSIGGASLTRVFDGDSPPIKGGAAECEPDPALSDGNAAASACQEETLWEHSNNTRGKTTCGLGESPEVDPDTSVSQACVNARDDISWEMRG